MEGRRGGRRGRAAYSALVGCAAVIALFGCASGSARSGGRTDGASTSTTSAIATTTTIPSGLTPENLERLRTMDTDLTSLVAETAALDARIVTPGKKAAMDHILDELTIQRNRLDVLLQDLATRARVAN
jgi:hypothetical protein